MNPSIVMNIETLSEWMPYISIGVFFVFALGMSIYHVATFDAYKAEQKKSKIKH